MANQIRLNFAMAFWSDLNSRMKGYHVARLGLVDDLDRVFG
jgi:hypothetical protein